MVTGRPRRRRARRSVENASPGAMAALVRSQASMELAAAPSQPSAASKAP
ncbi:MAG TPA: hypothetical protein VNT56_02520 [Acidimicrobiales bacterium]|nr:hypothetical protein [Acidimicrobiales bacterium]